MAANATVDERCQFLEQALKTAEDKAAKAQSTIDELRGQLKAPTTNSNNDVVALKTQIEELQAQLKEHHNNDATNSMDVSRIDDERKQVEDMKQDMQALQAMVVAQTAQLAMDNQVVTDVDLLNKELQQTKDLLAQANTRCETAAMDKQKATAALQDALEALQQERRIRSNLQYQLNKPGQSTEEGLQTASIDTLPPPPLHRAPSGGSMLAVQHVSRIAQLEGENRSLKSQLRQMRKRASSAGQADSELVQELRANLARACADIARLTVEVDRARNVDSDKSLDYKTYQAEIDQLRQQRDQQTQHVHDLKAMLQDTDQQLQTALHAMRAVREQACVEISVRKETVHTREKKGNFVPVNRSEEVSKVTWFTDENVKAVKTGPWQASEDRILLQAQLQHGNDWLEVAKLLPGRTDESICQHYQELVSDLLPDASAALDDDDVSASPPTQTSAPPKSSYAVPLDLSEADYETPARKASSTYQAAPMSPSAYEAASRQQLQPIRPAAKVTPLVETTQRSSGDIIVVV
eukprot:m.126129 g.126129  ORF g.126129 m.126129 type:complete len:523 (-) comp15765_c0_seq1:1389-2957(-)